MNYEVGLARGNSLSFSIAGFDLENCWAYAVKNSLAGFGAG